MKKKNVAIWLTIAVVLLVLGGVLLGLGAAIGGPGAFKSKFVNINVKQELVEGSSDEYEGVNTVKVEAKNIAVKIVESDSSKFKAEYVVGDEDEVPTITFDNGVLEIKQPEKKKFYINLDLSGLFNMSQQVLTVYVPKNSELDKIDINTSNGSINVEGELKVDEIKCDTNNGAVNIVETTCNESMDIKTSNGSVKCDGTFYKDIQVKTSNGRVELKGEYYGDVEVKTSNGSIDVSIDGDEKDYNINLDTSNGSIRVDGDKKSGDYEKDNNAENELKLKTSNGSIEVEFE